VSVNNAANCCTIGDQFGFDVQKTAVARFEYDGRGCTPPVMHQAGALWRMMAFEEPQYSLGASSAHPTWNRSLQVRCDFAGVVMTKRSSHRT